MADPITRAFDFSATGVLMTNSVYKQQAARLAEHFSSVHKLRLKPARALEAIAAVHGHRDWNTLSASSPDGAQGTKSTTDASRATSAGPSPARYEPTPLFAPKSFSDDNFCASLLGHNVQVIARGTAERLSLLEALIESQARRGSFIYIDLERTPATKHQHYLKATALQHNRTFVRFNDTTGKTGPLFNPLGTGTTAQQVAIALDSLPVIENSPGADFYRESARHALTCTIDALRAAGNPITAEVLVLVLSQPDEQWPKLTAQLPEGYPKEAWQAFIAQFSSRGRPASEPQIDANRVKEVLGGLVARLFMCQSQRTSVEGVGASGEGVAAGEFCWQEVFQGRQCMYLPVRGADQEAAARMLRKTLCIALKPATQTRPTCTVFMAGGGAYAWLTTELQQLLLARGVTVVLADELSSAGPLPGFDVQALVGGFQADVKAPVAVVHATGQQVSASLDASPRFC
jgi:hypothetical protein